VIEIWTERLAGTMAGGRALMAVYADHVYLGTLACPDGVAEEVRAALHLPDKLVGMHQPCHEPDVARELCAHRKHVGRDEGGVLCRECGRTYPCATARLATPAGDTVPAATAGILMMGRPGGGKTDGQAEAEARREYEQDLAIQEGR
jgi:hypothetical protein